MVPSGCGINVGNETETWEHGKAVVFDDSFEHSVWNNHPTEARYILHLHIWHPALLPLVSTRHLDPDVQGEPARVHDDL